MKRKVLFLLLAAIAVVSFGCGLGEWKEFSSDAGGFSVMMPTYHKEKKETEDTPAGRITLYSFFCEQRGIAYVVAYSDWDENLLSRKSTTQLLDAARDGAMNNIKGTLTKETKIKLDGYAGRELEIDVPSDQIPGGGIAKVRLYFVENRLYSLVIAAPGKTITSDFDKFLGSFKLK